MSDTSGGKASNTVPSKPGVMTVMSTVLHPHVLNKSDFCDWYENTHIQEVQATGGITQTQRYESLEFVGEYRQGAASASFSPLARNRSCEYSFITIYHMPDLAFRDSAAFKGLAGQSKPSDESDLLEKVFKHAGFCTRFCEELGIESGHSAAQPSKASTPAPYLISIGVPSSQSTTSVLGKLSPMVDKAETKLYKVHEASMLSEFKRTYLDEPTGMILLELNSMADVEEVLKGSRDLEGLEIGFWGFRRAYDGNERTPAPWRPK